MTRYTLRGSLGNYLKRAFDYAADGDPLLEAITDLIDYEAIVAQLFDEHETELRSIYDELANEAV